MRLLLLGMASLFPVLAVASVGADSGESWPRGKVFVPTRLFQKETKLDKIILESNPRLYVYPDFNPKADLILFIGMDGWGGRSENFIDTLRLGLKDPKLTTRLVIAAIQDPVTRGPQYQGQGDRDHANVWSMDEPTIAVLLRFVARLANDLGHLRVYFMGYSTGSVAAPLIAIRVAKRARDDKIPDKFTVEGAISLGTGSSVRGYNLKAMNQRVLFVVVPVKRAKEARSTRYDQGNRSNALKAHRLLTEAGAPSFLREIESARRHIDWHWGLMSQCRYFRTPKRTDDGRGYWPHYWLPNPDTFEHMIAFIQGKAPPAKNTPHPPTKCPYDPNPPDAR